MRVRLNTLFLLAAAGLVCATPTHAGIIQNADVALDAGAPIFTLDPDLFGPAGRNVAADRNLRQAFQYSGAPLLVNDVRTSLDVATGAGGLEMRIYQVSDTNVNPMDPGRVLLKDLVITSAADLMPTGTGTQILLSGADQFTLTPLAAPAGYMIELSNNDDSTNIGGWRHSNNGTDNYPQGLYYSEGGTTPNSSRDLGVSMNGRVVPEPSALLLAGLGLVGLVRRRQK
ncbi:MAG: PEP-CTERM sorting domain-containing protein [Planctomycetales bacterium]|nr:PEP-CTERM sorting domain-containing protein [Planctomycetales bacterium]